MTLQTLNATYKGATATIEFAHPAANSFPSENLAALAQLFTAISQREDINCIVLRSQGSGAFCAGASFDELLTISNEAEGDAFFSGFANVLQAMRRCPQMIIGQVQGKAVGGGVGLLAACDWVIATDRAMIRLSELAIGIGPFVIAPAVENRIGNYAMRMLTLAPKEWKNAEWALDKGLYHRIVKNIDELYRAVDEKVEEFESYNPQALREIKQLLWANVPDWKDLMAERAKISGRLVLSEFTQNALQAFKAK